MKKIGNYKIEFDDKKVTKIFNKDKLIFFEEYNDGLEKDLPKLDVVIKRIKAIISKLEKQQKKDQISKERSFVATISLAAAVFLSSINFKAIFLPLVLLDALSVYFMFVYNNKVNKTKKDILSFNYLLDQQSEEYHNTEDKILEQNYQISQQSIVKEADVNTNTLEKNKTLIK